MNEEPIEISETFDGYLMFDFSNFNGLMAQTFDDPEQNINDFRTSNHKFIKTVVTQKKTTIVPGPYLISPPQEIEHQEGDDPDVNFDLQMGDEDELQDFNLDDDDQCILNLQNSEFNLLENLDFEPDEDAYENAMNLTGNESSNQNYRVKTISEKNKKISIFSPTMHYEDNQELDKRIQMISIQNIELLKEEFNFDEFYKFLKGLDFLNFSNFKSNEDHIKVEQLITLVEIRIQFEKMCDMFQKWTHLTPSISFSSRLQFFHLQLDNFIDMVNYIIDNGAARQKHFQPREGLLSMLQPTQQLPSQSLHDKPNQIQQNWLTRQSEIMNANQLFKTHTLTMSVVFFKALEILEEYKTFLHLRSRSEKYKDISRYFDKIRAHHKFERFTKKSKIQFFPRKLHTLVSTNKLAVSTKLAASSMLDEQNETQVTQRKEWTTDPNIQKKIRGLDAYFISESKKVPLEIAQVDGQEMQYMRRNLKEFTNLKKQKFNCSNYLSMDRNANDE